MLPVRVMNQVMHRLIISLNDCGAVVVSQTTSNQQAILAGVILAVASLGTESNSPKNVRSGRRVHQTLEI